MNTTRETYGLHLDVYRWAHGDATNGGISATHDELCLIGVTRTNGKDRSPVDLFTGGGGGPWEPTDRSPACALHIREFFRGEKLVSVVPVERDENGMWLADTSGMFGGNYAAGDSRVAVAVQDLVGTMGWSAALKIHDRFER